jgi:hypothetical protein
MRYFRMRSRGLRFVIVGALGGFIAFAAAAAIALAAIGYPTDGVTVMTGCLGTSGTSAGNIVSVAVGIKPAKGCGSNQMLIHLSGGTITRVTAGSGVTVAGSGGTGGAGYVDNGFATLGLDTHYQLPQHGCAAGQFVAADGSGGWSCENQKTYSGTDFALSNQACDSGQFLTGFDTSGGKKCADDQTYTNGTGLGLSGNVFSLSTGFQLPQGCGNGEVAASNGNDGWKCGTTGGSAEGVSDLTDYTSTRTLTLGDDDTVVADEFCNSGDIATGGGWSVGDDATIVQSGPVNDNGFEGWSAKASTGTNGGFEFGHVTVYVKCLTTLP